MTETAFREFVAQRFSGKLTKGKHSPDGAACFHEALNVYRERRWSDTPVEGLDLRGLNDAPWSSDEARTEAMVPLGPIVLEWPDWTPERRQAWAKAVAEGVIRRILPPTLRRVAELVPDKAPELVAAALRCETEGTASAAESAAWAAAARSASWAARSASWAARSASWAAESASWAAASASWAAESAAWAAESSASAAKSDAPLQELCSIMLEARDATDLAR